MTKRIICSLLIAVSFFVAGICLTLSTMKVSQEDGFYIVEVFGNLFIYR